MWIGGRRRGGAKDLSKHLLKEENEAVKVRDFDGFSFDKLDGTNLERALRQMEAIGYGKGAKRNLYHAIVAPAYGETLTDAQRKFMVAYYAEHMGFKGYQCAVVEHWKNGKQHFHLVFNIIDPITGKTHELKWTKRKEWQISRGLEEIFGFLPPKHVGKQARTWEMQRGKRTGVDPRKVRKEVTAIFNASKTAEEFKAKLDKAGYTLTRGKKNQLVFVDQYGDTHGLLRRIEGKKLADLRRKFPGIEHMELPSHEELVAARKVNKPIEAPIYDYISPQKVSETVRNAFRASKTGAEFFAELNRHEFSLGRGIKGFAVIDRNGGRHDLDRLLGKTFAAHLTERFPDLAEIRPKPVSEILRRIKAKHPKRGGYSGGSSYRPVKPPNYQGFAGLFGHAARRVTEKPQQNPAPFKPTKATGGWPEAAVQDWESWGHKEPVRFFMKWPELKPDGFIIQPHQLD